MSVCRTTVEHFPDLHEFRIEARDGADVLVNSTRDGREQVYSDLVYHGGGGATLEMRVFSRDDVLAQLRDAGFLTPRVYEEDAPECGMMLEGPCSLTMSARTPV